MIHDISRPLDESFAVFPGDVPFSRSWTLRLERGDSCNVSCFSGSAHAGTHVDLPYHFSEDLSAPALEQFFGRALVIDVDKWESVLELVIDPELRVLFKTRNSAARSVIFDTDFTCITSEVVEWLKAQDAVLVGVDAPSVDPVESKTLDNHHALRNANIGILENLDLSGVGPGAYDLIALPLKIPGADATWVRAVLRDL